MTLELVTHDGKFHADEILSTVILTDLYPDARIVRTRDLELIAPADRRIVYDVGLIFDPERMCFDHHQADAPVREDGVPYSSFGMIWAQFGVRWLEEIAQVPADDVARVHQGVDRGFVSEVDSLDNGVSVPGGASPLSLTRIIEAFAPDFDDPRDPTDLTAFISAVTAARVIFGHHTRTIAARVRAARIVSEILATHDGGPVLVLPYGMPWEGPVRKMKADHIMFAVIDRQDSWSISTMRVSPGSFDNRVDFPAAWAGLTGPELVAASGIPDALFVHKARFYATASSLDGALEMTRRALEITKALENPTEIVVGV